MNAPHNTLYTYCINGSTLPSKNQESMIRKYHNHTPQTNPRHCEEEPFNNDCHKPSGRQLTLSKMAEGAKC